MFATCCFDLDYILLRSLKLPLLSVLSVACSFLGVANIGVFTLLQAPILKGIRVYTVLIINIIVIEPHVLFVSSKSPNYVAKVSSNLYREPCLISRGMIFCFMNHTSRSI